MSERTLTPEQQLEELEQLTPEEFRGRVEIGAPPLTPEEREVIAERIAPPPPVIEPELPEGAVLVEGVPSWIDPVTEKPTPVEYKPVTVTTHTGEKAEVPGLEVWRYNQLQGKEQFEAAVKLGFIPPDSKYIQDVAGKWQYIPEWEEHLETLRKERLARLPEVRARAEARETLKKYRANGTYNIALALKEGVPAPVILAIGFPSKAVNEARTFITKHTLLPDKNWIANSELSDLKKKMPNIYEALTLVGFGAVDVIIKRNETALDHLAKYTDKAGNVDGAAFLRDHSRDKITLPNAGFTPEQISGWQAFNKEAREQAIEQAKVFRSLTTLSGLGKAIWRFLTPWEEQKETFLTYSKKHYLERVTPSQEQLKAEYETARKKPRNWAEWIFPSHSLVIRQRDGTYVRTAIFEVPLVGPASKAKLLQTLPINWTKLIKARPRVSAETWKKLMEAIQRGAVKNADDASNWVRLYGKPPVPGADPVQTAIAFRGATSELRAAAASYFLAQSRAAGVAHKEAIRLWTMAVPINLTQLQMTQAVQQAQKLSPSKALTQLSRQKLLVFATLTQPQVMVSILAQVSPQAQARTLTQLQTQVRTMTELANLTTQQQQQLTRTMTQVRTQVKTQTKAQVIQKATTQVATRITAPTVTKITPAKLLKPPPVKTVPIISIKLPRRVGLEEEREERRKLYPITWRQGFLGGRGVWWVVYPPYKSRRDVKCLSRPPKGATVATGADSAYDTIQSLGGDSDLVLDIDAGAMDILIRKPKKKAGAKGAIRFRRDLRQKTKGDLSLAGIRRGA